jgi:Prolyl oligopeptidase family
MPKTAPYGSWKSPITSDLIATQSISLSEPRLDGEQVYWLEGRPQELGRYVVVRASSPGGRGTDVTPRLYNARTRVHEYGGGSWMVADGDVYFSNFADGRLYSQGNGTSHPLPLTPEPLAPEWQWRFADGVIDPLRQRWIGVREDHTADGEPINSIVAVDLRQPGRYPGQVLVDGHDFVASPRAEDAIVPQNQAEALVNALRHKGKPVGYLLFCGEQHGFRKAATIQRCLDAELHFYAIEVFKIRLTF